MNNNQPKHRIKVTTNYSEAKQNNSQNKRQQKIKTPGHDYRRRTRLQTGSNKLEKNLSIEIPVSCMGLTKHGKEYSGLSLINILDYLQICKVFSMISIPIWIDFAYIDSDNSKTKNKKTVDKKIIIGYMKYFKDTADAGITIYRKYIDLFKSIHTPIIVPRVAVDKEDPSKVKCIIGLDIMDRSKVAMFDKGE